MVQQLLEAVGDLHDVVPHRNQPDQRHEATKIVVHRSEMFGGPRQAGTGERGSDCVAEGQHPLPAAIGVRAADPTRRSRAHRMLDVGTNFYLDIQRLIKLK